MPSETIVMEQPGQDSIVFVMFQVYWQLVDYVTATMVSMKAALETPVDPLSSVNTLYLLSIYISNLGGCSGILQYMW